MSARRLGVASAMTLVALATGIASASADVATSIDSGPTGQTVETSATFSFGSASGNTFECSVDRASFSSCTSPYTVGPLARGQHSLAVRAVAPDGSVDPTPATRTWTIVSALTTPTVTLAQPAAKKLARARLVRLSGTASGPSGVTEVQVALTYGRADKNFFPPACHFVDLRGGQIEIQPCLLPPYIAAQGTKSWHYDVPRAVRRHLARGKYTLIVRAFNRYGQATQARFGLTLR